jgi:hypothetical protein
MFDVRTKLKPIPLKLPLLPTPIIEMLDTKTSKMLDI